MLCIVKRVFLRPGFNSPRIPIPVRKCLPYSTISRSFISQDHQILQRLHCLQFASNSNFHMTQALHMSPFFILFAGTSLQYGSFLIGCYLRRWWLRKSETEREEYKRWFNEKRSTFLKCFGFLTSAVIVYYVMHLERDPVVKRLRFIVFNKTEQAIIGNIILSALLTKYKESLLPEYDPMYTRLSRIIRKLIVANPEVFGQTEWTISIVDAPLSNAMVLPGGNIFVFSGIFDVSENDDQLTFILAHEMSHVLLLHAIELVSYKVLTEIMQAVPTILVWTCFSKWQALMLYGAGSLLYKLVFLYPYKRRLEVEADEVGFKLAAKTCIDLREVLVFWRIMGKLNDLIVDNRYRFYWFSTHPRDKDREKILTRQMPHALKLRKQSGCSELPAKDPRTRFEEQSKKNLEDHFREKGLL